MTERGKLSGPVYFEQALALDSYVKKLRNDAPLLPLPVRGIIEHFRQGFEERFPRFQDLLLQAKVILCEPFKNKEREDFNPFAIDTPESLSMPFDVCWIEPIGRRAFIDFCSEVSEFKGVTASILGFLVCQHTPDRLEVYLYCGAQVTGDRHVPTVIGGPISMTKTYGKKQNIQQSTKVFLSEFERCLRESSLGEVSHRKVVKARVNGKKIHHRIRKIVYVVPKRERESFIKGIPRSVDWSHRWLVRGHWRRVEGKGKNRNGDYEVEGFTWVREFEKGPEGKPLVSKVRVVA